MARKVNRREIKREDLDSFGCIDIGMRLAFVGGLGDRPEAWAVLRDQAELEANSTPEDLFDRLESWLIPIAKPIVEEVREGETPGNLTIPLMTDLGDGEKQYCLPVHKLFVPQLPTNPSDLIDIDQLAFAKRQEDAWWALGAIQKLRAGEGASPLLFDLAFYLGGCVERLKLDRYRDAVLDGLSVAKWRKKGGSGTAMATKAERRLIVTARDKLARKEDRSKKWAAGLISNQLKTGVFKGIDRPIEYAANFTGFGSKIGN